MKMHDFNCFNSTQTGNENAPKRSASTSSMDKLCNLSNKDRSSVDIKQENDGSHDDDFSSLSSAQPPMKKLRAEFADAESNTTNSGE